MLIVANWKMQRTFAQTRACITGYVATLVHHLPPSDQIVICPSTDALMLVYEAVRPSTQQLFLGAQQCGPALHGPFTGQVSPQSLAELGCTYCIIGHSEARAALGETQDMVIQKAQLLRACGIIPLICIGETAQEHEAGTAPTVLTQQLTTLLAALSAQAVDIPIYIAYEPRWAIGTGRTPTSPALYQTLRMLQQIITAYLPLPVRIMYGGSVQESTIAIIQAATTPETPLHGLMVGSASLDAGALINLISLWYV